MFTSSEYQHTKAEVYTAHIECRTRKMKISRNVEKKKIEEFSTFFVGNDAASCAFVSTSICRLVVLTSKRQRKKCSKLGRQAHCHIFPVQYLIVFQVFLFRTTCGVSKWVQSALEHI